jgi:CHAD domain-containing protein
MVKRLPSYRAFGLRILLQKVNIFRRCMLNMREQNNADAVHDLRVASRRFRAASLIFRDTLPPSALIHAERRIRRVRKTAGDIRDGDVQIEFIESVMRKRGAGRYRTGLERLLLRLSQRREKRFKRIVAAMDSLDKSKSIPVLLQSIRRSASRQYRYRQLPLRNRSAQAITAALNGLFRFEQFVRQPSAAAELHRMRIAAKRLRYVMEIFNPVYKGKLKPFIRTVRSIQDTLGQMHDCDVWLAAIPEFIADERRRTATYFGDTKMFPRIERGMLFLMEYARTERMKQYRKFLRIWNVAAGENFRADVTKLITPPKTAQRITIERTAKR